LTKAEFSVGAGPGLSVFLGLLAPGLSLTERKNKRRALPRRSGPAALDAPSLLRRSPLCTELLEQSEHILVAPVPRPFVLPHTVQTRWRSLFARVAEQQPEWFPHRGHDRPGASSRGVEKRRHLLAYLERHLEELRPRADA
jgi:hypothetical protein